MPLNYKKSRTTTVYGPTENELKKRNNTVRKVFNAKGIPRNMGNKEILRRVKVYNNVMSRKNILNFNSNQPRNKEPNFNEDRKLKKMKIANFISNGRVFNQRKRKALVELMLRFDIGRPAFQGGHIWEILDLKNEDVIRYIKYMADYFGTDGVYERSWSSNYVPHYIFNLMYKGRGPIREDPGAVRVLKKRTAFLKEMLKIRGKRSSLNRDNLPRNMQNKINLGMKNYVSGRDMWLYMRKEFPLPPYPKYAATKIQAAVRGMRNRKKLTTMRKAATTIQKRVRGMINRTTVKKMKTVAGKRKRSPSPTSIKTTSPKRTRTNR